MDLELKIENFGPIDEATIQVGRFTVFAGPNNTGKTFVSKMLYSILSVMNANHVPDTREFFNTIVSLIETILQLLSKANGRAVEESSLSAIRRALQKIDLILRDTSSSNSIQNELDPLRTVQIELMTEIKKIKVHSQALKNDIETKEDIKTKEENLPIPLSTIHDILGTSIDALEGEFENMESVSRLVGRYNFRHNVHGNFQEPDLSNLKGNRDAPLYFSIQGVGELWGKEESFEFTPDPQIVQNTQSFPEVFYLESPLYWKLKTALESIRLDSRFPSRTLNGVPDYFYDMVIALKKKRIEHPLHPFGKLHKSLHDVIGGQISLSEADNLEFQKDGKSIPLPLTSAGVANMGMLALLIERGALERGSFLFIDEPESNLHPAWQVEMAAFLFELARQGVNVVVSTHSMTILKWLEVHVKKKPEDRELVRLNKFPPDAEWNDDMDMVLAEVKQSLTKPFSDLYIEGL